MNLQGKSAMIHVLDGWRGDLLGDELQHAADVTCLDCGREWLALFPVSGNAGRLECPECHGHRSKPERYYAGGHYVLETKKRGLVEMDVIDHE